MNINLFIHDFVVKAFWFIPGDRQYVPVGCYKDKGDDQAFPILIKNFRKTGINWKDMSETIAKCAYETTKADHNLQVFAIQFYGECYTNPNGLEKLNKNPKKYPKQEYRDDDKKTYPCWEGVGRDGANFVYKFEEFNGESTRSDGVQYCAKVMQMYFDAFQSFSGLFGKNKRNFASNEFSTKFRKPIVLIAAKFRFGLQTFRAKVRGT